jgi:hypothetical protein
MLIATIVAEANGSRAEVRMWGVFVRVLMPIGRSVGCAKCQVLGIHVGSTQSAVEQTAKGKS